MCVNVKFSGTKLAVLAGHDLSCIKRDRVLFDGINFSVDDSELLYIKGPNGAGKTSLLRIIVGLAEADRGEVLFQQEPVLGNSDLFLANLVYFGHKLGLNQTLNAVENLSFWCEQHNVSATKSELFDLLGELGLVGLEDIPVGSLSAGQQRRVALARLWLKAAAKVWVLDEPFTALDVQGIALLEQKILSHLHNGNSIVMTSHQALTLPYPVKELLLEYRI